MSVSRPKRQLGVVVAVGALLTICAPAHFASASDASTTGVTPSTITVGVETTLTGPAAPTFSDSAGGVQAAFDLENSLGGVDGRQLKYIVEDDQSSPVEGETAASLLATDTFAVIEDSAICSNLGECDTVLNKLGVPDITWGSDITNPNTFSISEGGSYGKEGL